MNIIKLRKQIALLPSFCKDYFRSIEPQTTSRTRISYAYDLKIFFDYLKKNNPLLKDGDITLDVLDKLSFQDIEEYMEYLKYYSDDDNKEKLNSVVGIKRKIASLRSFYKYFYKNDLIKNNPTAKVSLPKIRDKEIIRLENDEVSKLLDEVEQGSKKTKHEQAYHKINELRDTMLISLLLGTGIRVSECVNIDLDDIDLDNTCIKIKRKGGKEQFIYYSDELAKLFDKYLKYRKTLNGKTNEDDKALFLSIQNKRISIRAVENLVKKYAKTITPLKHITPHKLRSTFGTNLYKETDDIYLVASILGHSDVNTTKKHYAAIEQDQKRAARNKVLLRE